MLLVVLFNWALLNNLNTNTGLEVYQMRFRFTLNNTSSSLRPHTNTDLEVYQMLVLQIYEMLVCCSIF